MDDLNSAVSAFKDAEQALIELRDKTRSLGETQDELSRTAALMGSVETSFAGNLDAIDKTTRVMVEGVGHLREVADRWHDVEPKAILDQLSALDETTQSNLKRLHEEQANSVERLTAVDSELTALKGQTDHLRQSTDALGAAIGDRVEKALRDLGSAVRTEMADGFTRTENAIAAASEAATRSRDESMAVLRSLRVWLVAVLVLAAATLGLTIYALLLLT